MAVNTPKPRLRKRDKQKVTSKMGAKLSTMYPGSDLFIDDSGKVSWNSGLATPSAVVSGAGPAISEDSKVAEPSEDSDDVVFTCAYLAT